MKHLILRDGKISLSEYKKWEAEDAAFFNKHIGIVPTYFQEVRDYSDYPTTIDSDGDDRPAHSWLTKMTTDIATRYGEYGVCHIIVLVHEDNWKSGKTPTRKGIWGTNLSNVYRKYHVHYCRWDKDNPANTFGTLYHERHHSFDSLIATELGIDVRPILGLKAYDAGCTHGGEIPWKYIRHQENTDSLVKMKPYLQQAHAAREKKHREYMMQQTTVISLLEKVVYLWRQKLNIKNGITK
jgi:hypothetical protein